MRPVAMISILLFGLPVFGQVEDKLSFAQVNSTHSEIQYSFPFHPAPAKNFQTPSVIIKSRPQLLFNDPLAAENSPAILPKDFQALRPTNFLDRIYFGGSNDLLGLRPVAIAQQRMPDPMLKNLHTLYIRSSIGIKNRTRLVLHCECLLFVKTMSNMAFLLPQLGLRQRF